MNLHKEYGPAHWGWQPHWQELWQQSGGSAAGLTPCRVIAQEHRRYRLAADQQEFWGRVSGAFSYRSAGPEDYPAVGDWVGVEIPQHNNNQIDPDQEVLIQSVLPRKGVVSRKVAGRVVAEQVICANVDVLLLVFALDGGRNFVPGLVERAAATAWESGARPVIILNKSDCATPEHMQTCLDQALSVAPGVQVVVTSAVTREGMDELVSFLESIGQGTTVSLLGKSGVGKSALINTLTARLSPGGSSAGAREGGLRSDMQGRHTTTHKHMYSAGSFLLVDVPGMRELQLWGSDESVDAGFPEIEEFAAECRFSDCRHQGEPGCAVQQAIANGEIDHQRYERYLDLQREVAYLERQRSVKAAMENKRFWKQVSKDIKGMRKM